MGLGHEGLTEEAQPLFQADKPSGGGVVRQCTDTSVPDSEDFLVDVPGDINGPAVLTLVPTGRRIGGKPVQRITRITRTRTDETIDPWG